MRNIISFVAASAIAASSLVLASAPAQAAEFSPGGAVIRIDAPSVSTTKVGENSYRMVLEKGAKGPWMSVRTRKNGNEKTLVGDLTAAKLVKH